MARKKVLLVFTSLIIALILCEALLRVLDYKPGIFRKVQGFELVDSLVVYKNFVTDEAGIYKFSPWVSDSFPLYFDFQRGEITNPRVARNLKTVDDIDYIYQGFYSLSHPAAPEAFLWKMRKLFERETDTSEFAAVYHRLLIQKTDTGDDWAMAFMHYVQHPFNHEGFKSIEFKRYTTRRKKILLIGDSFVYGMNAEPRYNCFADILLARGYLVYSAGIPGTDPAQYAAIAEKYIPLLRPDIVLVCFYEGNDYMYFARVPAADKPHEHITNAGLFESSPAGIYLSPEQAYQYARAQVSIPQQADNLFNGFCAKTALGSLFWGSLFTMKMVDSRAVTFADSILYHAKPDMGFTANRMGLIDSTCKAQHSDLKIIVIPNTLAQNNLLSPYLAINKAMANTVMGARGYYTPGNLRPKSDFRQGDYHFNNRGSLKFADFLDSLLHLPPAR